MPCREWLRTVCSNERQTSSCVHGEDVPIMCSALGAYEEALYVFMVMRPTGYPRSATPVPLVIRGCLNTFIMWTGYRCIKVTSKTATVEYNHKDVYEYKILLFVACFVAFCHFRYRRNIVF